MWLTVKQKAEREGISQRTIQRRYNSGYYKKTRKVPRKGRDLIIEIWDDETTNDNFLKYSSNNSVVGKENLKKDRRHQTTSDDTTDDTTDDKKDTSNIPIITEKTAENSNEMIDVEIFVGAKRMIFQIPYDHNMRESTKLNGTEQCKKCNLDNLCHPMIENKKGIWTKYCTLDFLKYKFIKLSNDGYKFELTNIPTITEKSAENSLDVIQIKKFAQASDENKNNAFAWEKLILKYEEMLKEGKKQKLSITKVIDLRFIELIHHKEILEDEKSKIGKITIKTLRRKRKQYIESGRDVSALLPRRKGNSGRKKIEANIIYQHARILGSHSHKLRTTTIYEILGERFGKPLPISYGTLANFIKEVKNDVIITSVMSGKKAWKNKAKLHIHRINDAFPGQIWQSDGHTFNFLVKSPFVKAKDLSIRQLIRPVIVLWLDMATEMITGWACSYSESFPVVVSSFRDGVERWGVPSTIYFDNGSAFKNVMTMPGWFAERRADTPQRRQARLMLEQGHYGIFRDIGVEKITLATPGNPESKKIEPFFRNLFASFEKLQFTYLGENTQTRPEHMNITNLKLLAKYGDKIPTWENFLLTLNGFINKYNNKEKEALKASPKTVYEDFGPFEISGKKKLDHCLSAIAYKTVNRDGINIMGIPYEHPLFAFHIGDKVKIQYDVRNLKKIKIASMRGEVWEGDAYAMLMGSYTNNEMSVEAIKANQRNNKTRKIVYSKFINETEDFHKPDILDEARIMQEIDMESLLIQQNRVQKEIKKLPDIDDYLYSFNLEEKEKKPILIKKNKTPKKKYEAFDKLSKLIGIG